MKIEEDDFIIESSNDTCSLFDLQLLKTVKPKGGEERKEFQNYGYGMPMENCLKMIIKYKIEQKHPDVIDLKTYLNEYKQLILELKKLVE